MIVYLCTKEYALKLAFLEERNIVVQEKSDMTEELLLNYIKMDLRNLDIDFLFIDMGIFKSDQDDGIFSVLKTFNILFPRGKVILLYENEVPKDLEEQYQVLEMDKAEESILQIVNHLTNTEEEEKEISDVVDECVKEENSNDVVLKDEQKNTEEEKQEEILAPPSSIKEVDFFNVSEHKIKTHEGVPLAQRVKEINRAEVKNTSQLVKLCDSINWTCSNVVIAFVGAERRTGTTTAAMHLCTYLRGHGAKVSYSEAVQDKSKHLKSIAEEYEMEQRGEYYEKDSICFYCDSKYDPDANMNFIILDLGTYDARPDWVHKILNKIAQKVVVVAGGRLYELQTLEKCLEYMENLNMNLNILLNFTTNREYERALKKYGNERVSVYQGMYEPDLFAFTSAEEEIASSIQGRGIF